MKTKELTALLKHCKDTTNPKYELNGVYVDGNKLVCTDTKQLLVLEFEEEFTKNKDQMITLIEIDRAKGLKRPSDLNSILDANNMVLDELGFKVCAVDGRFPDYKRIIPTHTQDNVKKATFSCDDRDFPDFMYYRSIRLVGGLFQTKYLLKFASLVYKLGESANVTISQADPDTPLKAEAVFVENNYKLKGFTYIVMPVMLDEEERG